MRKTAFTIAMLLVLALLLPACGEPAAPAEPAATPEATEAAPSMLDTIMNIGTTQAFTDEAVPQEDIDTILRAGLIAESASNQQPWFFVAITDHTLMEELNQIASKPKSSPDKPAPKEGEKPAAAGDGEKPATPKKPRGPKAGLGDTPLAIVVYKNEDTRSRNPDLDCGLAVQNMYLAAGSLGYGSKLLAIPARAFNGDEHDAICEKLGVDKSMTCVVVLLVGKPDTSVDGVSGATERAPFEEKTNLITSEKLPQTDEKLPKPGENEMPLA